MTKEQWLVYLWSIYPNGEFMLIWFILLMASLFFIGFLALLHFDVYEHKRKNSIWSKMGKWKVVIPAVLTVFIFISYLVPKKEYFAYIIATPYVVESGKSIVDSLNDPASKLYKLNSIMDKGLDKVLDELTKKEKSN